MDDEEYPPLVLADMRLVYGGYGPMPGGEHRHKVLATELKDSPRTFMDRMVKLEAEWQALERKRRVPVAEKGPDVEMEGYMERMRDLVGAILRNHGEGS